MLSRITWFGCLLGCCLLVRAEEPDAPAAEAPAVKKAEPPGPLEGKRGQFAEKLKQLKEMKKGEGGTPGGAGAGKGRFADMLKQLKGKQNREPLDPNKFKRTSWKVGEETREALIYAPPVKDPKEKRPVVFAFHGHGGSAENAVRRISFHETWPEAISIYPQGLPTVTPIDPEGQRSGWQTYVGNQENRDLLFFDAMLKTLAADYQIDVDRVYACGHSNGGYMSYVLLAGRGDQLAAVAPIAATHDVRNFKETKPKPVFHVAGQRDPLVKFTSQERSIEQIRKLNGCDEAGKPAGEFCTEYSSKNGPPVVAYLHPGAHEVPAGSIKLITEFFQKYTRGKVDGAPRVNFYPRKS